MENYTIESILKQDKLPPKQVQDYEGALSRIDWFTVSQLQTKLKNDGVKISTSTIRSLIHNKYIKPIFVIGRMIFLHKQDYELHKGQIKDYIAKNWEIEKNFISKNNKDAIL